MSTSDTLQRSRSANGSPTARPSVEGVEDALLDGDLSKLSPQQRIQYMERVCDSVGLNPLTKPFRYIRLNGSLTLYATRDAAEQLRKVHGISITSLEETWREDLCIFRAYAEDAAGRTDVATGAVDTSRSSGQALANDIMKAECVPLDSEILTRDGFKTHDEVERGVEVLAYDVDADKCKWTPLQKVTVHESLPMSRLATPGGQFEAFCTADHSWAIQKELYRSRSTGERGQRGPYENRAPDRFLCDAQDFKTSHKIILARKAEAEGALKLSPVEAAILGWAVTDGTIQERGSFQRIGICQSKEENFEVIEKAVEGVASDYSKVVNPARERTFPSSGRTYETLPQHWWYLPASVSRDILRKAGFIDRSDLPNIVTRLGAKARRAMLHTFMLAEGDERGHFYQSDPHVLEAFQILCALEGKALTNAKPKGEPYEGNQTYSQRVKKTRHVACQNLSLESVGEQSAWCPTTKFGTWVMRQPGGRVMITGNTKAKRRVTLSLAGLGWLDETEITDIPDSATEEVTVDYETGEVQERRSPEWYRDAIDWLGEKAVEIMDADKVIDAFPEVPDAEHPVEEWPRTYEKRAFEHVKEAVQRASNDEMGTGEPKETHDTAKAAGGVETASEDANHNAFTDDDGLPF
jgi:hypothetical protein